MNGRGINALQQAPHSNKTHTLINTNHQKHFANCFYQAYSSSPAELLDVLWSLSPDLQTLWSSSSLKSSDGRSWSTPAVSRLWNSEAISPLSPSIIVTFDHSGTDRKMHCGQVFRGDEKAPKPSAKSRATTMLVVREKSLFWCIKVAKLSQPGQPTWSQKKVWSVERCSRITESQQMEVLYSIESIHWLLSLSSSLVCPPIKWQNLACQAKFWRFRRMLIMERN